MLLGGLWHGASWNFVIWGGLHGLFLLVNHAWRNFRYALGWSGEGSTLVGRSLSRALTLFTVFFAWAFFRAEGWDAAMIIIDGLTGRAGVIIPDSYAVRLGILAPLLADLGVQFGVEPDAAVYPTRGDLGQVVLVLMIVLAAPNTQQIMAETEPALGCPATEGRPAAALFRWRPNAVTGAFTAAACFGGLALLFRQASNAFIYFQF
jgi:alginate O-acetyltransferase complex protein AlgI